MTIICGDCLEEMKKFPDNHFSCVCTDPPYGISFMGKKWDHGIPSQEYWKEMLRIVKPGGHLIAAGLPRMMHRLICTIEDSGWHIRDLLMHLFGSGFPKSHNHFGLEGYGTTLKPSWEGWSLSMKPLEGTFKQNAEKWGQAGINIDGCRIPTNDKLSGGTINGPTSVSEGWDRPWKHDESRKEELIERAKEHIAKSEELGRWPANLILDEEAGKLLDEQSGILKSGHLKQILNHKQNKIYGKFQRANLNEFESSSGGASRFFYCPKASSSERNEGLEGMPDKMMDVDREGRNQAGFNSENRLPMLPRKNNHPTVKPLKLMEYLIKLVMPPQNGLLLDPFAGSGTTILAAKRLGFDAIGIEKSEEYCEIARARCKTRDPSQFDLFA